LQTYGEDNLKICQEYDNLGYKSIMINVGISLFVVILNEILTRVSVKMITWIGFSTFSEQYTSISNCIFVLTFFNTGVIILFANADLSEAFKGFPLLANIFNGPYNDYSSQWYGDVGNTMIQTMMINVLMPIISFKVEETLHWFEVRSD
jgi:hypothetical protein